MPPPGLNKKHLAQCSIPKCKQLISENCSLHVFPNERDPRRKQWIRILKVERDVPRHYRICSKHFKASDFFPRHQMQKKLMLRPTAVPTENLPPEITDAPYIERPDSPENTSSSFISLDHSDSNGTGLITSTPITAINNNNINNNNNNNNTITTNNNNDYSHEDVKLESHFTYQTPQIATIASNNIVSFQPSTQETLTPLSTVPYQEINQDPVYSVYYDGTEIDSKRLATVLNKDDGDGTITVVLNYMDY